jgi:hypothetical protein
VNHTQAASCSHSSMFQWQAPITFSARVCTQVSSCPVSFGGLGAGSEVSTHAGTGDIEPPCCECLPLLTKVVEDVERLGKRISRQLRLLCPS